MPCISTMTVAHCSRDSQREEEGVFVSILKMPSQVIPMSGPFSQMRVTGLIVFLEKFWICIFKKEGLDPSGYEMP